MSRPRRSGVGFGAEDEDWESEAVDDKLGMGVNVGKGFGFGASDTGPFDNVSGSIVEYSVFLVEVVAAFVNGGAVPGGITAPTKPTSPAW